MRSIKPRFFLLSLLTITAMLANSCDDILENDISKKIPVLISPADMTSNDFDTQHFAWEEIEGADFYRLMVAEPNFAKARKIALDTTVTGTMYSEQIPPGQYQWRLQAMNVGYKSNFAESSFRIDSTYDISDKQLLLIYPLISDTIYDVVSVEFRWDVIRHATSYTIFIQAQNDNLNPTISQSGIATNSFTTTRLVKENMDYKWMVKAIRNDSLGGNSETQFSETGRFSVRIKKETSSE